MKYSSTKKNLTKGYSMTKKIHLKTHNKNKNHNHNEIHTHMSDKKTKPRRRRKTTRKPRDAPVPYQTFQPAPVPKIVLSSWKPSHNLNEKIQFILPFG